MKRENIEVTGEEEIDQGYEGPVNTNEKKNHNETKAKYQAKAGARVQDEATELSTETAKLKSFQARDQMHGQVSQLYHGRYLAGSEEAKEHSQDRTTGLYKDGDRLMELLSNLSWDSEDGGMEVDDSRYLELIGDGRGDQFQDGATDDSRYHDLAKSWDNPRTVSQIA